MEKVQRGPHDEPGRGALHASRRAVLACATLAAAPLGPPLVASALVLLLVPTHTAAQQGTIRYVNRTDHTCQGHTPCYPTIQAGVATAHPGDTVRIQAGTYPEQVHIQEKNNVATATEADRIIIEADPAAPPGSVVVTGGRSQCTNGEAIRLAQSKFITLRGLTITGAGGQAIALLGGNNQNRAIHIERNRIFGNGSSECDGGITIARGNPDTVIANNLIYANGRNGIATIDADGGPHYIIENTIHANQWNGLRITRTHVVFLVNNLITGNGTATGSTGGRFGVSREASTSPQPAGIHLLNNLICGNRLGEIDGPALDATDANNLTPTGAEGPGVTASPGCELSTTVYDDINGPDQQPNTADDPFTLKATSPAIDRGMDPRTLGLNPAFNPLLEADFAATATRPRDGNQDGMAAFDMGAREFVPGGGPVITNLNPASGVHGQTVALTITGTGLTGATALTFLKDGTPDVAITATGLSVNAGGTQLTASVAIGAAATLGQRVVTVTTPGGTSPATATAANTFTVLGQITLVPDFLSLVEGQQGGLTVQLSAPAPSTGLTVNLSSAAPGIASVPTTVTIAGGTTSAPTTVTAVLEGTTNLTATASGFADGLSAVTVRPPVPTLTGFNPTSDRVGATVVLTGTGFRLTPSANSVSFTGATARVPAAVTAATATSLTIAVPAAAVTGPLQVTTSGGAATSAGSFVVLPTVDFTLSVGPGTATVIQGGQASYAVTVAGQGGFTGLVTLGTSGLPAGATATFTPPVLSPGQIGTLAVQTGATTPLGSQSFTITASGLTSAGVTGKQQGATLSVLAAGGTALTGRILDEDANPVQGVTLTLAGQTTRTDAAGNFLLQTLPPGPNQFLFLDGSTAVPDRKFPTFPILVTIVAGQINQLPYQPFLHAQKATGFVDISNNNVQRVVTDPTIPGFQMTLPAGVSILGWDGQPNTQVSVRTVPLDRMPIPHPDPPIAARSLYMFYFNKVGGGTPSQPVPVTAANDLGLQPGDKADLWYYDEGPTPGSATNTWRKAGTATVSADGQTISTDPGVGLPRFCCGAYCFAAATAPLDAQSPGVQRGGDPVDLSTGLFLLEKTDLVLPGRLPVVFSRTYRTNDFSRGPFGVGTSAFFSEVLLAPTPQSLIWVRPGNTRIPFARQPDGTYTNTTIPGVRGAAITANPDGTRTLRFKDGATQVFEPSFQGSFQPRALTDRNGNTVTTLRDAQDRPVTLVEPSGRRLDLTFVQGLLVDTVQDPIGRQVRYTYDAASRLTTVTDPAGGVTRYTYDNQGRMLTITDPRGFTFLTNTYSASGRVVKQLQADGGEWRFAYMLSGASVTGPGCPGPTCPGIESPDTIARGYTFSGGFVVATTVTDPRGNPTTYRFNNFGQVIEQIDAIGQSTKLQRAEGTNLVLSTTDALGRVTRFAYDPAGNVTAITDPAGNIRTFTYNPTFNKVTSITDPLGNVTRFAYDPTNGNLLSITDPLGAVTQTAYNAFGQPVSTTDALGNVTQFTYTAQGDLERIADPLANTTTREYDAVSRLVRQLDPRGKPTAFEYDPLNRLLSIADALGGMTGFGYDPNGNLVTVTNARGNTITHDYDSMDWLSRRIDQLGAPETFTYDGVGNLVSTTDRKGQTTTFTYDGLNRRVRSGFADGAVATFTYDPAGRLLQADDTADPHRPIVLEYDALNRLLAETTSLGTVSYAYDPLGRRTRMTVSGQSPVAYTYDAASRLRTIRQAPLNPVDIQYDALGRRTLLTLPNGVSTEYQYDAASRLTALIYRNAAGPLGDLTYQYDPAGNRVGVGGSFARTLLPDPVPSATYDAANRQLTLGGKTMTFDANGNLVILTEGGQTTTYTWNGRDQLTSLTGPGISASFAYDGTGRRSLKTIGATTTTFQYDGRDIVREVVGGAAADYLRGLAIDESLARIETTGNVQYLADPLRSTLALTDGTGNVATTYTYDPFGQTAAAGASSANPFQYTDRENDGTGLYYYRARYYRPDVSRFLSEDPIGLLSGDANFYAYVGNRPTIFSDPHGLWYDWAHERLTLEEGVACGLSSRDVGVAAEANRRMDSLLRRPWQHTLRPGAPAHAMPGTPWREWSGRQLREAVRRDEAGSRPEAMRALGEGLHSVQDAWAHDLRNPAGTMELHYDVQQGKEGVVDPDDPAKNTVWWELARGATRRYIRDFMRARGLKIKCELPEF